MVRVMAWVIVALVSVLGVAAHGRAEGAAPPKVETLRVPDGGIQPQVVADAKGTIHLLYYKGDPSGGDLFYTTRGANDGAFAKAIRVNTTPGAAVAMGNMRGGQIALGRDGRVFVSWNGSKKADHGVWFTRLDTTSGAFEKERNLMTNSTGLDGGATLCADGEGRVFVAWHGVKEKGEDEQARRIWVARSADDGKTFAGDEAVTPVGSGACSCCAMRAVAASDGTIHLLYRSVGGGSERDMQALNSRDHGKTFTQASIQPWSVRTCPMSTASAVQSGEAIQAAWETDGQVHFATLGANGKIANRAAPPGETRGRRHPAIAVDADGNTLLAWTEGMGWSRGGSLAWELFDKNHRPLGETGEAKGVPTWSLVAAVARPGGFVVIY